MAHRKGIERINGRTCRAWVQQKQPFQNSNGQLYAQWEGMNDDLRYVVYSYGRHWPLFVYVPKVDTWFENTHRKSPTTSKHRSYSHPGCDTVSISLNNIFELARDGYSHLVTRRLING